MQNGVRHGLLRIAALHLVTLNFLNPLEVDDRGDTNLEIGVLRNVDVLRYRGSMQALVKKNIGPVRNLLPRRELTDRGVVKPRLFIVVNVMPRSAGTDLAV